MLDLTVDNDEEIKIENDTHKVWFEQYLLDLEYENYENICYAMNTSEIFPYDTQNIECSRDRVLRPELVCMYDR